MIDSNSQPFTSYKKQRTAFWAITMAFTLIGTGTTAISPKKHNTFIAHAAPEHNCQGYKVTNSSPWQKVYTKMELSRNVQSENTQNLG